MKKPTVRIDVTGTVSRMWHPLTGRSSSIEVVADDGRHFWWTRRSPYPTRVRVGGRLRLTGVVRDEPVPRHDRSGMTRVYGAKIRPIAEGDPIEWVEGRYLAALQDLNTPLDLPQKAHLARMIGQAILEARWVY